MKREDTAETIQATAIALLAEAVAVGLFIGMLIVWVAIGKVA